MKERITNALVWAGIFLASSGLASFVVATRVHGHDMPGKSNPDWYREAETNPESRNTFPAPWTQCCNHAEVIPVKDIVFPAPGHGWQWNDKGTIKDIPEIIIHYGENAPDNQPTLFVYIGIMTCFYPPMGGA